MPFVSDTFPSRKVFIPITDEILYDHPELITAPLRPYRINEPCFHWLSVEVEAADAHEFEHQSTEEGFEGPHRDAA